VFDNESEEGKNVEKSGDLETGMTPVTASTWVSCVDFQPFDFWALERWRERHSA
jgi:hypothetical protein